jgi:acetyl esterase
MLDPQAQALIDLMVARAVPPVYTLSVPEARKSYLERRFYSQPDPPPVADVRALRTDSGVPLRLYRNTLAAEQPALVYCHGGGWTIGDLDTHDVLCRQLCLLAGITVVAVDYRLAPEHRFPAAVDDCVAATRWVQQQASNLNINPARLAIGGDSAGGNLAAVVCLLLRDQPGAAPALRHQLLIYPATDMRAVAPSHISNGSGYLLTQESVAYYRGNYISDPAQWADWRASPLLAPNLRGLPPALVLTAGYDPLRDEGRQYADALSAAGNAAQYICFERQLHGFITMGRLMDEANTAVALCANVLTHALKAA